MILANLFYWGTNQYVIQRTLGAKNLVEGQKGVLFSGYFKVLVPFMMMLPGVIAYHLYQDENLQTIDLAYPHLVKDVLPQYLSGFFLAVLLGAVFSSFNSLLNSAATLFCLDVYKPLKKEKVSDEQLIRVAKITSLVIAILSFVTAPLLMLAPEGLWQIIRIFTGFYNIPVITIVLVGLFTKRVPALAAKVAIIFHVIAYGLLKFVWDVDINFIHIYAILFAVELTIMLVIGRLYPMHEAWQFTPKAEVNMTPWRYAIPCAIVLVTLIATLYLMFSPIGFVGGISNAFIPILLTLWATCFVAIALSLKWWTVKYERSLTQLAKVSPL
jgi:SSS family solute:Na+ symporter